ncbi:MAG: DUF1385 domain-containing protein [Oscillospiraceae bacterium]|jgi:uncharacterized protein YqhQ|nr:DUF1385 domain-containing protein [Oscillospiraceae bacterium]
MMNLTNLTGAEADESRAAQSEEILIGAVGGEALMEGIMMRGPAGAAISLRLPDHSIETTLKQVKAPKDKWKPLGWPLLRGPVSFIDSIIFGYRCMMEAAEKTTLDDAVQNGEAESKLDKWIQDHFGPKMMAVFGAVAGVLGVLLALGLFVALPTFLFDLINKFATQGQLVGGWKALVEGGIRVLLLVGYMFVMSQIKDIRRVFQYHGAEHKSIFCYENGLPLTVENVRKQSRLHPRCGTSFLFIMVFLSILVSAGVLLLFPELKDHKLLWWGVKLLQFPVIMSLGYEFIRFAGRHSDNIFIRILSAPGLGMQCITTKEPSDDIIEVGICALEAALGRPFEPLRKPPEANSPEKREDAPEIGPFPDGAVPVIEPPDTIVDDILNSGDDALLGILLDSLPESRSE